MSAILVDCCAKRNIKVMRADNAVCLNCLRHYYAGQEYTKKEWDELNAIFDKDEKAKNVAKKRPKSCSNCLCWEEGFCTSGDSMEPGERRHLKVGGDSVCEAHMPIEQPNKV